MVIFSNSKINLGLWVLNKREDGYHNISTIFYPIGWSDIIEIIPDYSKESDVDIEILGLKLDVEKKQNIIYKAYCLLQNKFSNLPFLKIYLYKNVPFGAGLGGGSANAAYFIKACNDVLKLNLSKDEMKEMAAQLGADCAFFIENKPMLATEKGDKLEEIQIDLSGYYLYVVFPNILISTKEAYQNIQAKMRENNLAEIIKMPITQWKNNLDNDFERYVFLKYPEIEKIKQILYDKGAVYASLSGSGSAVYGIFYNKIEIKELLIKNRIFFQEL
ncbi:MAG: 4-(cytidine 5'-diphospho)-2-C-methyl-D-erythritol kinase [Bacteroidota bacterium]